MTASTSGVIYDSDQRRRPLYEEFKNFWEYRGLLRLLVVRDLTVRYKRSTLGIWWTILNPLLVSGVLWIVFSAVFRFEIPDPVPFIVYLLSGIILITYFAQAVVACGSSIVNSAGILTKVYVPPEVFALASALAAATNFFLSLIPLLVIQLVLGVGIPWTVVFVPLVAFLMLMLVTGLGLLIAALAVYFYDVLDLTNVWVQLIGYLTPTFYPITLVPPHLRVFVHANPVYSYLHALRDFVYRGEFPDPWMWAMMLGTSTIALVLGVWAFSKSWKNLVVVL